MDIGIVGGSGYGGAELLRLLDGHPSLKVAAVGAHRSAGERLGDVFGHLRAGSFADTPLRPAEPEGFEGCAVVFLATPHEASLGLAPALLRSGCAVVDLSAAFRLEAGVFGAWYGLEHTAPQLAPAVYGLPELFRDHVEGAQLVASPGCYPTAALLALAPLAGLVDPSSVVVAGMSGTSGAGKGLRDDLHASHAIGNVAPYGAPRHRHTPEIAAVWGELVGALHPVTFIPHLVPMPRGLLCTVVAQLTGDADDVHRAYLDRYGGEPFVSVLDPGDWPATTHVVGGNGAHVGVAVDSDTGRVTVACAIDNLVKGAAGQALQAANLMLGLPEGAGLTSLGIYP